MVMAVVVVILYRFVGCLQGLFGHASLPANIGKQKKTKQTSKFNKTKQQNQCQVEDNIARELHIQRSKAFT